MEITTFNTQSLPTVSHIHIDEISKGVQKLNQILRACSNGHNFDRNSLEVGKELLKGAMDLEESLRMLVNMQDGSQYANGSQKKSRLKLLEEDEDDQDDNINNKIDGQWKLDRPKFSFDKPSRRRQQLALPYTHETSEQPMRNSEMVLHERSRSYIQDLSLSLQVNNKSQSTQEKGRISNVIAKLMGLEEIPLNDDSKFKKNDTKGKEGKQGKVSRENTNKKSTLTKIQLKPEKSKGTPDVTSERNQQRKDLKARAVGMEAEQVSKPATAMKNDQQSPANQANAHKSFEDSRRKQSYKEDKQESKIIVSSTEQQKKAQNIKKLKAAHTRHSSIEQEISANSMEKRNADKEQQIMMQKPQVQVTILQEQMPKRAEHSEDRSRVEQKVQKQNLMAKINEGLKAESIIASKSKRGTATNGQKKLSHDKSAPGNGVSMRPTEKVPTRDPPNRRHQDTSMMVDIKNEDHSHNSTTREPEIDTETRNKVLTNEKPMEVQAPKKRPVPRKVERSEIPQKIDVLLTRRNATVNHLERSIKKPANILKDLKQQMHKKNCSSKRMEEKGVSKVKEEVKLQNDDDQTFKLSSNEADESQLQNKHSLNDIVSLEQLKWIRLNYKFMLSECSLRILLALQCKTTVLSSGEVLDDLQTMEQSTVLKDEGVEQCDQSIGKCLI